MQDVINRNLVLHFAKRIVSAGKIGRPINEFSVSYKAASLEHVRTHAMGTDLSLCVVTLALQFIV